MKHENFPAPGQPQFSRRFTKELRNEATTPLPETPFTRISITHMQATEGSIYLLYEMPNFKSSLHRGIACTIGSYVRSRRENESHVGGLASPGRSDGTATI